MYHVRSEMVREKFIAGLSHLTYVIAGHEPVEVPVDQAPQEYQEELHKFLSHSEQFYATQMFRRLTAWPVGISQKFRDLHLEDTEVASDIDMHLWGMAHDTTVLHYAHLSHPRKEAIIAQGFLDPVDASLGCPMNTLMPHQLGTPLQTDPFFCPWPMFMAFSLMHCKNVTTELVRPDPKKAAECKKHNRPRTSYHVLKLELPKVRYQRSDATAARGPGVRCHIVSGHFKDLQHQRYINKGLHWWPAHYRGDPELGTVLKDYQLTQERKDS
jgi:hypothetical protein